MWRVGVPVINSTGLSGNITADVVAGLRQGLAEMGYLDGQTIAFDMRDAEVNLERLPELMNDLVQIPVDVLFCISSPNVAAAHRATTVVPIVFASVTDPVGKGWIDSLAHPGGNLTGVSGTPTDTLGKIIEYLAQVMPRLSRIAFFASLSPSDPSLGPTAVQLTTSAANALGIQLKFLDVPTDEDVESALADALAWGAEAMMAIGGIAIVNAISRFMHVERQNRIPFVSNTKEWVQAGALLSYSPSYFALGRQAAHFVDKILKGAKPADLPVEETDTYELVVSQTTAQALGISIPPQLAEQVTEWVQ